MEFNQKIFHLVILYQDQERKKIKKKKRIWSNGKISLCQGEDAGSIPAIRPE